MKVAITSQGDKLESPVDPRFGRAKYFIVLDTGSGAFSVLNNEQNLNSAHGAGIQAAKTVSEAAIEAVITGFVGPKAFSALETAGISVYTGASGSVAGAVAAFKAGALAKADAAVPIGE